MFDDSYWRFFMRHHSASLLVVLSLTFLVALAGSGTRAPAAAADCGDGVGPCRCGDTVVTNTTLNDTDPVTATVCPCDGLLVASGVELNLGGRTISGSGVCIGVRIGPSGSSFEASVGGGRITKFGTGVHSSVEGGYTRLHHLRVIENSGVGVSLSEVGSVIEDCIVSRNGGAGIRLVPGTSLPAVAWSNAATSTTTKVTASMWATGGSLSRRTPSAETRGAVSWRVAVKTW
jgi:hypothetical protein